MGQKCPNPSVPFSRIAGADIATDLYVVIAGLGLLIRGIRHVVRSLRAAP